MENIAKLAGETKLHTLNSACSFVFKLFSNTARHCEQYYRSTSLLFKSQGRFHLGGNIVVSPADIFKKTIDSLVPILKATNNAHPGSFLNIAVLKQTTFTNSESEKFKTNLLNGFTQLCNTLIHHVVASSLK
jgi:hypothetical protein